MKRNGKASSKASSNARDDETRKQLKFTCPQCGGKRMDWVQDCPILRDEVVAVTEDGEIVWGKSTYGASPAEEDYFQCYRCDLILKHDDEEETWVDEESLVQWLRANCAQEDQEDTRIE
jgi:hypothetical protein